jgi:2-polyprenyl-3-methyl-5-hydroxy-6-metoxy-1,4-benzoquinol methylase
MEQSINDHNAVQLNYYGNKVKKRLMPRDTYYLKRHIDEFVAHADMAPGASVLDVGCGMGKYSLRLLEKGFDVSGLDLSPFLLQKFKEYDGGKFNPTLYNEDIHSAYERIEKQFDHVIGFFTLHHLLDLEKAFSSMSRLLKPGGSIIFLEPNAWYPLFYIQIAVYKDISWSGDKGIVNMRSSTIGKAAKAVGLSLTEAPGFGLFPPFALHSSLGQKTEKVMEKVWPFNRLKAFKIFKIVKPF